jgi:hypothetical protein
MQVLRDELRHEQQYLYTFRINKYRKMTPAFLVYLVSQKKKKIRQKNEYEHSIKQLEKHTPVIIG